jgi:hypothetical protein
MNFQTPEEVKLTFLLFISMLLAAAFIACEAHAYVPSSQFIFNRVTSIHGKGAYSIEDEVSLHEGNDTLTLKENWIVIDGGEMRVAADGGGARIFRVTKKGRDFWVDSGGSERSEEIAVGNVMRPLLTRSSAEEKKIFVNWGILPPEVLRDKKAPPKDIKEYSLAVDPFVRLGRVGGTITYTYGKPSPPEGAALPGLWIEQDQFVIRKMRAPDGSEVQLSDSGNFSKNLAFPKNQIFTFDNHSVAVRVLKVSSIDLSSDQKRQFDTNWLRSRKEMQSTWPTSPLSPVVQEFYKRFR